MSTPAVIQFVSEGKVQATLLQTMDGYPESASGMLVQLRRFFESLNKQRLRWRGDPQGAASWYVYHYIKSGMTYWPQTGVPSIYVQSDAEGWHWADRYEVACDELGDASPNAMPKVTHYAPQRRRRT